MPGAKLLPNRTATGSAQENLCELTTTPDNPCCRQPSHTGIPPAPNKPPHLHILLATGMQPSAPNNTSCLTTPGPDRPPCPAALPAWQSHLPDKHVAITRHTGPGQDYQIEVQGTDGKEARHAETRVRPSRRRQLGYQAQLTNVTPIKPTYNSLPHR